MNVLVTGATGFIGRNLAELLVKQGHTVYCLVRKTSNCSALSSLPLKYIYGDISDAESLRDVPGYPIEAVFHCAAYVGNDDKEQLYKTNVLGTENICSLCEKLKSKRLIYLSSVAVVNGHNSVPLREDAPLCATNPYGLAKLEAEKKVLEYRQRGNKVAIIRPCMVYGKGEPHAVGKLLFLLRLRMLPFFNRGCTRWHLVHVSHVAGLMAEALVNDVYLEGSFFVADEEIFTVREVFSTLAQAVHGPVPFDMPQWSTPLLSVVPYFGPKLKFFLKDRVYDISRLQAAGFFKNKFDTRRALVEMAEEWLTHRNR